MSDEPLRAGLYQLRISDEDEMFLFVGLCQMLSTKDHYVAYIPLFPTSGRPAISLRSEKDFRESFVWIGETKP